MTGAVLKNDQLLTDLAEDFQLLVVPLETPSQKQIGNFLAYAERGAFFMFFFFFFLGGGWVLLLMEEILHHLGCKKPAVSRISEPSTVC